MTILAQDATSSQYLGGNTTSNQQLTLRNHTLKSISEEDHSVSLASPNRMAEK